MESCGATPENRVVYKDRFQHRKQVTESGQGTMVARDYSRSRDYNSNSARVHIYANFWVQVVHLIIKSPAVKFKSPDIVIPTLLNLPSQV